MYAHLVVPVEYWREFGQALKKACFFLFSCWWLLKYWRISLHLLVTAVSNSLCKICVWSFSSVLLLFRDFPGYSFIDKFVDMNNENRFRVGFFFFSSLKVVYLQLLYQCKCSRVKGTTSPQELGHKLQKVCRVAG